MSLYHTHRMPELYAQPNVFNPYRWLGIERDVFEFTPFNSGPRMCLGVGFSMAVKGGLPMIVRKQDRQFTRPVGRVRGNVHQMLELVA